MSAGPSAAVVQTAWVRLFCQALEAAGVRDLVVSPGARSTPLVAAAARTGLRRHVLIDERAAAFFALGQARVTGRPTALLCTSGTAGAHYYPAVIEASYARVPLVVVTADRPPELHGCAAPQTIDQLRLFGEHVRMFCDLGAAEGSTAALRAVRRKAAQAVAVACGPLPGPVHVNAPARKPLEPREPDDAGGDATSSADQAFWARAGAVAAEPLTAVAAPRVRADDDAIAELATACAAARRGLLIAGPSSLAAAAPARAAAAAFAERAGFPLLAEATSGLRFGDGAAGGCDGFDALLSSPAFRGAHRPDLVIELGAPPISEAWAGYLAAHPEVPRYVLAEHGWGDPHGTARALIHGPPADTLARLTAALPPRPGDDAWRRAFAAGSAEVWRCAETELGGAAAPMSEPAAVRAAAANLPAGALLALGNSLPVRAVDTWCPAPSARVEVICQRGASGIDGLIAGAAGAASAGDRPVALLCGDVSFAHDVGGLAAARNLAAPLVVIVIDNDGGRIFEQLPLAGVDALAADFTAAWLTPPRLDAGAAAALYGHRFVAADRPDALAAAVRDAATRPGCTIVWATVAPGSALTARRRLIAAVDAALCQGETP